jgi:hypothetical protein
MAGAERSNQGEVETRSVGEIDVEEVGCEPETEAAIEGRGEPVSEDVTLGLDDEAELDEMLREADPTKGPAKHTPPGLGPRGGARAGSEKPIQRVIAIGRRNGLTITSTKRTRPPSGSDHHVSQNRSSAADMSNGSSPTPQMDKTCRDIATLLGHPEFEAGNLRVTLHGYRVQLLYRTDIGGNHFNHVHVGVRVQ